MNSDHLQGTHDSRHDGLYQRGGGAGSTPAPGDAGHDRQADATPSVIREIGGDESPELPRRTSRNPYDVWMWVVAATITALGFFFTVAPIMYERRYAETPPADMSSSVYVSPWFNYTSQLALPLILVGTAAAVVQLALLSYRHTLTTRRDSGNPASPST